MQRRCGVRGGIRIIPVFLGCVDRRSCPPCRARRPLHARRLSGACLQRSHCMNLLQKGHVTTEAQQTQRTMDGNLCAPGVSTVRFYGQQNVYMRRLPRDTPDPAFWYVLVEAQGCGAGSCPSETADHKRGRNEFAPVLQSLVSDTPVPCPWVRYYHHCCH